MTLVSVRNTVNIQKAANLDLHNLYVFNKNLVKVLKTSLRNVLSNLRTRGDV